mmetsp:Transcript_51105/g.76340  ORF Transcript_51105/g.76340 Transcript_51105/m.76340 type:complete len:332 (-) Transcript_51105:1062-2057(-)|eukprot:CAMPEP_0194032456 /NCGR_PEP_ID=MMETSP0009_2-20130614/5390_1 /TAXON_ID=210454 /ORGANISM="Grammatophora oceanica, Strain CCMP 410" /LENGTH=331 /DNA_ID=CAMNT_0038672903 /DNA_START=208 /DNA_END=1203 /DNA_ORIENTATION=+
MESVSRLLIDPILVGEDEDLLQDGGDESNPYASVGFIIWYVFLVMCCGLPTIVCMVACAIYQCKRHDEEQLMIQEEVDAEIERIEANIQAYRTHEKHGHKQLLVKILESSRMTLQVEHFEKNVEEHQQQPDIEAQTPQKNNPASQVSSGCSICLNKYVVGDEVTTSPGCGHMFHMNCLMDWFLSDGRNKQQTSTSTGEEKKGVPVYSCPCCRQPFIEILPLTKTPPASSSLASCGVCLDQRDVDSTSKSESSSSSPTRTTEDAPSDSDDDCQLDTSPETALQNTGSSRVDHAVLPTGLPPEAYVEEPLQEENEDSSDPTVEVKEQIRSQKE